MKSARMLSLLTVVLCSSVAMAEEEEQWFPPPGDEHKLLNQMAGEWNTEMTCNMPGQDAPVESKGQYSAKVDLGGYFLIGHYKGAIGDHPFQGRSITGYDPFQKKYTGVWVDSMGPSLYKVQGEFDKTGKVYTEDMEGPGPDGKPMKFHSVIKIEGKDKMQMTMSTVDEDGKQSKMMEVNYTRK